MEGEEWRRKGIGGRVEGREGWLRERRGEGKTRGDGRQYYTTLTNYYNITSVCFKEHYLQRPPNNCTPFTDQTTAGTRDMVL